MTIPDLPRRGRSVAAAEPSAVVQTATPPTVSVHEIAEGPGATVSAPQVGTSAIPAPAAALVAVDAAAVQPGPSVVQADTRPTPSRTADRTPAVGLPAALASVADQISSTITSVVSQLALTLSGNSPFAPPAEAPATWALLAFARRQPAAATTVTAAATTATSTGPALLVLNGYNVVAASQQVVTSFYSPMINWPAYPGIESVQEFNLVDPSTNEVVGSFRALQSTLVGIGTSRELLVTEVLSGAEGTAAGQIPPQGSVISSSTNLGFGTLYTAMPAKSGNVTSFKLVSPFGDLAIPVPYDGAKGLTDFVEINKPLRLSNGVSFAPTVPSSEVFTAVTGSPPLFTNIQGTQSYTVSDKNGVAVGSFDAVVATTSDALGVFTKLIKVVDNGGSTNADVPPVGTVYNLFDLGANLYALYSSTPSANGKVKNLVQVVTPWGGFDIAFDFTSVTPPTLKPLQTPSGYKFVPTSGQQLFGANGLPPREMSTQTYQQFDVVDLTGKKIGAVDADVTLQWDSLGGYNDAILITKVNSGTPGALPWNVPPVGSVLNIRRTSFIDLGIYDYYSSIPSALGDVVSYGTVTPIGFIPATMPFPAYLSAGLSGAKFVDPYAAGWPSTGG